MALLFLVICSLASWAQTRMISHVTRADGGFVSTIILENSAVVEKTIGLQPYDSDGMELTRRSVTIPATGVMQTNSAILFGGEPVSHFLIEGDAETRVQIVYDFDGEGSPAHVPESALTGSIWRVYAGDWSQVFDGLAMINRGALATDIWVAQIDFQGNVLHSERVATGLGPNAKSLYVIGSSLGSAFMPVADSYFEVSADQHLVITALRGSLAGSSLNVLWSNGARPMSQSESRRDEQGIWHITDGSLFDVHEMMGYNVAFDRLWQAELFRHTAQGRQSELFGQIGVVTDTVVRVTGYSQEELDAAFVDLDEETRLMIVAYTRGFNRLIGQVNSQPDLMPFEFPSFGITQVNPWTPTDVMAVVSSLSRAFTLPDLGVNQIDNVILAQDLISYTEGDVPMAAALFEDLRWVDDPAAPTVIERDPAVKRKTRSTPDWTGIRTDLPYMRSAGEQLNRMVEEMREFLKGIGAQVKMGSYAWVLSGSKTVSGNPILFSGPQVGVDAPSPVIEGSIESDELTVSGMTIAGLPGFVVGRTPHHAWSFQVGHAHTWDFYYEDAADVTVERIETIKVAGGVDVLVPVAKSKHGPIVVSNPLISWKYSMVGYEFELSKGLLNLARARDVDAFGEAVANLGVSQQVMYADREDNIAYWLSGREPVRPEGEWRFPQGFLPPLEWDAAVVKPLTHERNPERGFYGGWNNQASADRPDQTATYFFGPFHRSHMILDWLENSDKLTFEQVRDFAFDVASTFNTNGGGNEWGFIKDRFIAAVHEFPSPERLEVLDVLEDWSGFYPRGARDEWLTTPHEADGLRAQRQWLLRTIEHVFGDEMPSDRIFTVDDFLWQFGALLHAMDENPRVLNVRDWFKNIDPEAPQTMNENIVAGLDRALEIMGSRPWAENQRNVTNFTHTILGSLHQRPLFNKASYAQCVELDGTGPIRIESSFALGPSGVIYLDMNTGQLATAYGTQLPLVGEPPDEDPFFSMSYYHDNFLLRLFPLFGNNKK